MYQLNTFLCDARFSILKILRRIDGLIGPFATEKFSNFPIPTLPVKEFKGIVEAKFSLCFKFAKYSL